MEFSNDNNFHLCKKAIFLNELIAECFLQIILTKQISVFFASKVNSNDIVFPVYNSGLVFSSLRSQLCVCMMSHSDNRAITVSHLIPSHSWMLWIFTEQPLIKNGK